MRKTDLVVNGRENWSFILREGHSLTMFDDEVLRRIFEYEGEKVRGYWRMHQESHDLYTSPNNIRIVESGITCYACRVQLRFLFKNPEGTMPLGKHRRVEVRMILKLILTKLDGEGLGWADLFRIQEIC